MCPHVERSGLTLVELLVTLALLGILLSVSAPALRRNRERPYATARTVRSLVSAVRRAAIREGRVSKAFAVSDEGNVAILALPDGRVLTSMVDTAAHVR